MILDNMERQYHGTNSKTATNITNGLIDRNLGGGELGKGFYTGNLLFEAIAWAWHKYKKDNAVAIFSIEDTDFLKLDPLCLDKPTTIRYRNLIRCKDETKIFEFNKNAVWAPIVGKEAYNFTQIKFESKQAEDLINGKTVIKEIFQ